MEGLAEHRSPRPPGIPSDQARISVRESVEPRSTWVAAPSTVTSPSRMAEPASVAVQAAPTTPSDDAIARVAAFAREPFVLEGEDAAAGLAPGSARRRAFDAALAELDEGAKVPSVGWRQRWSLLLGLDRLLCQEEPHLADGTVLSAHQVDALSGTLTALLAESGNGSGTPSVVARVASDDGQLASVAIPGEEELDD